MAPRRSEYQALIRELPALARVLDAELSTRSLSDLERLITAVDSVDRALDPVANRFERRRIAEQVLSRLSDPTCPAPDLPAEVQEDLHDLRGTLMEPHLLLGFHRLVAELLANSEAMRSTRSLKSYIHLSRREAELLVEAALLLLHEPAPALRRFLRQSAGTVNLFDKLCDARADYRQGELQVRPGRRFHLALGAALLSGIPSALYGQPRPLALLSWAGRLIRAHLHS